MPALVTWHEDDKPDYARTGVGGASASAPSREALDIPPSLRGDVEVPMPDQIATGAVSTGAADKIAVAGLSAADKKAVAGKSVALDARVYEADAAHVFSSVVDAMTALDLPVQGVDSPSGTITTDWIRKNSKTRSANFGGFSPFGSGDVVIAERWRFVVRVFRQKSDEGTQARLEIRTVGQAFMNKHWVNRQIKRKVSAELFSAVEERL
ncbi:MAG: hypothetical protein ABUK11_02395 [Mariprofundaceae bacterium]